MPSSSAVPASPIVQGDFTSLAKEYVHRPGYSRRVLEMLGTYVGTAGRPDFAVADVGAGTGKLTLDLLALGFPCRLAVEPNDAMRAEGEAATQGSAVTWRAGSGEATGLETGSADWLLMGSSFHWVDLERGLAEFHRVLRPGGHFTAIWNPRDVRKSALHARIEARIERIVPDLRRVSSGAKEHTLDLDRKLVSTGKFERVLFTEEEYVLEFPRERYLGAWRSVNDIQAQAGPERFAQILTGIEEELGDLATVPVPYKTRAWTVRRVGAR